MAKMNLLADMSGTISMIETILLCVGIGLIVVLVLCFLRGLLRGWKYGTYRLVFIGILIAIAICILGPVSQAIGEFNISNFVGKISFNLNNKTVVVTPQTIFQTLKDLIYGIADAYNVKSSPAELLNYSYALASSTLKLLTLAAEMLIIIIIGQLLCLLFWHVLFKRIFMRKERAAKKAAKLQKQQMGVDAAVQGTGEVKKFRKLRLVSAFEEFVLATVCVCLFLMPFTAIASAVKNNFKAKNEDLNGNEILINVNNMLNAYDNSIMSKIFFDWTKGDGTKSLDMSLMDFLGTGEYGTVKTSLINEVSNIASVGGKVVNSGLLKSFNQSGGIKWYMLLTCSTIPEIITTIANVDLVKIVLPFAVNIAMNIEDVKNVLGEETIAYLTDEKNQINWTNELKNLSTVYQNLLDSGLFNCIVEEDEYLKIPRFNLKQVYELISSDSTKTQIHNLTNNLNDSKVLNRIVTGLTYTMSTKEEVDDDPDVVTVGLSDFLPKEGGNVSYNKMTSMDWFRELRIVYDGFYDLNKVNPTQVKKLFDDVPSYYDPEQPVDSREEEGYIKFGPVKIKTNSLTDVVIDNVYGITDILVGKFNNTEPIVDAKGNSTQGNCMLDSDLLANGMPKILDVIEKTVNDSSETKINLDDARAALNSEDTPTLKKNFKKEYKHVLEVLGDFAATDDGKAFLKDLENHPGLYFDPTGALYDVKESLVDSLMEGIQNVDNSLILTGIIPAFADNLLTSFKESLSDLGMSEFKFPKQNLGTELSKLFSILKYSKNVVLNSSKINSLPSAGHLLTNYSDELIHLIDTVAQSKILNPENVKVGGVTYAKNYNLTQLLNNIFSKLGDEEAKLTVDEVNSVSNLYNPINYRGEYLQPVSETSAESSLLVTFMKRLANSPSFDRLDKLSLDTTSLGTKIEIISTLNLEDIFTPVDDSYFLPKIMSSVLDKAFEEVLDLKNLGMTGQVSFKNIAKGHWQAEGRYFNSIIYAASNGLDLANLNFLTVDSNLLSEVLVNLASSNIFVQNGEYVFPKFLYNKLIMSMDKDYLGYVCDPYVTKAQIDQACASSATIVDKQELTTGLQGDILSLSSKSDWLGEGKEIERLTRTLNGLNAIGGPEKIEKFNYESLPLFSQVLKDINECRSFGRVLLYNACKTAISDVDLKQTVGDESIIVMSDANTIYLWEASREARTQEINDMVDIFYRLYDPHYGLIQSGKGSSTFSLGNIDPDYLLEPLLKGMKASTIFGVRGHDEHGIQNAYSIFEELMIEFVARAGVYADAGKTAPYYAPINLQTNKSISEMVLDVSEANGWEAEIDSIVKLVRDLKSSPFLNSSGGIDFSMFSKKDFFQGNPAYLESVSTSLNLIMNDINSSEVLYRCLPSKLETPMKQVGDPGSDLRNILGKADFYYTTNGESDPEKIDYGKFSTEEIDNFINSIFTLGKLSNANFTNLSTIDFETLTDGIALMGPSGIFNSKKDGEGLTSFTAIIKRVLNIEKLGQYLYMESSPKDAYHISQGHYNSYEGKVLYTINNVFGQYKYDSANLKTQIYKYINGRNDTSLYSLLNKITNPRISSILDSSTTDLQNLSYEDSYYLLSALNNNEFFYDAVPNLLAKLTTNTSYKVENIFLDSANIYYHYDQANNKYDAKFDDSELSIVLIIFNELKSAQSVLNTMDLNSIDLDLIHNLLVDMSNSEIFHEAGAYKNGSGYGDFVYNAATDKVEKTKMSIYEQFMFNLYKKSSLGKQDYQEGIDYEYYSKYGASAQYYKLYDSISNFNGSWLKEVDTLIGKDSEPTLGFLSYAKSLGFATTGSVSYSNETLSKLNPDNLMILFGKLNDLSITSEAARNTMASLLTSDGGSNGIGLNKYSAYVDTAAGNITNFTNVTKDDVPVKVNYISSITESTYQIRSVVGNYDLSGLVSVSENAGVYTYDLHKLTDKYVITFATQLDSATVSYDSLYYLQTKDEMTNKDMIGLHAFLQSAWHDNGDGTGSYFEFKTNAGGQFNDYLKDHSVSGIIEMLRISSMFSKIEVEDASGIVRGRSVTLGSLMSYESSFSGSNKIKINMTDYFSISVGDTHTSLVELERSLSEVSSPAQSEELGHWIDNHILDAGLMRTYIDLIGDEVFESAISDAQKAVIFYTMSTQYLYGNLAIDASARTMRDVIADLVYSVSIENENRSTYRFARNIVAGVYKGLSSATLNYINLLNQVRSSFAYPTTLRINVLPVSERTIFVDAYGTINDGVCNYDFAMFDNAYMCKSLSYIVNFTHEVYVGVTSETKDTITNIYAPVLDDVGQNAFLDQFYLGYMYDALVNRGKYKLDPGTMKYTDLYDVDRSKNTTETYVNYIDSLVPNVSFSYALVASVL